MNYRDKQAYAKTLGINAFGMKGDELDAAIAEAEANGIVPKEEPAKKPVMVTSDLEPIPPKTKTKAAPQPQGVDPAAVYAVLSQEINEKFAAMQQAQPQKKPETPEAVIAQQHATDVSIIAKMPKVPVSVPGGYVGAPKRQGFCVNGFRGSIKAGEENVMVPVAVAEVLVRSRKLKQKNMERNKKLEQAALDAGL